MLRSFSVGGACADETRRDEVVPFCHVRPRWSDDGNERPDMTQDTPHLPRVVISLVSISHWRNAMSRPASDGRGRAASAISMHPRLTGNFFRPTARHCPALDISSCADAAGRVNPARRAGGLTESERGNHSFIPPRTTSVSRTRLTGWWGTIIYPSEIRETAIIKRKEPKPLLYYKSRARSRGVPRPV